MSEERDENLENEEAFNEEALVEKFSNQEDEPAEDLEATPVESEEEAAPEFSADGTELESFESAEIEEEEFIEDEQVISIVESILFSTEKPVSPATIKQAFKGTQVRTAHIRRALDSLAVEYASGRRGITLEEVSGGYQLRTKVDNMNFLRRMVKARPFKLSGPALEVLAIIAYKQPMIKAHVDEIRGVESGHLLRALMEKGLVNFAGKSEFPGKPMLYQTTRKFLEIFGLRNLKELPSLSEIDDLIPEGIGDEEPEKETLDQLTDKLSEEVGVSYSQGEEELMKISAELEDITTSSEFFEQEKARMKAKKEAERAQDIRDAMAVGEEVEDKDKRWLERYEAKLMEIQQQEEAPLQEVVTESGEETSSSPSPGDAQKDRMGRVMTDLNKALSEFDQDGLQTSARDDEKYQSDLSVFEDDEPEAEA